MFYRLGGNRRNLNWVGGFHIVMREKPNSL